MTDPRLTDPAWLRDMCACAECRDPHSGQHLLDIGDLAGWVISRTATVDRHRMVHAELTRPVDGVHKVRFELPAEPVGACSTWGAEHLARLRSRATPWGESPDRFVADLANDGIALLTDVEPETGRVLDVARRVGFVRATNYGELFDVEAVPQPTNLAYSPVGLPLHTDNPYRSPRPTVQLLHCLRPAAAGGASQFSDGFRAAEQLRAEAPQHFEVLTATSVEFRFRDTEVDLCARRPLVDVGPDGALRSVAVNHRSMQAGSLRGDTAAFYSAYGRFASLLQSPDAVVSLTLAEGELVAFDNRRVLHARSGFDSSAGRHLQGCYIDIDAVASAARVLNRSS